MNIKTWQHRVKVNGEWEGDAMKLEIEELRAALLKAKQELADEAALRGMVASAIGNQILGDYIAKHGNPPPIVAERDALEAELEQIKAQKPVAWRCTKRIKPALDPKEFSEPFIAINPEYVKAHPHHDWTPLYTLSVAAG